MAGGPDKNDKPSKGDEGNKTPSKLDDDDKLYIEYLRLHDLDGPNAEQWAAITCWRGMSESAVQKEWAELEERFVEATKNEVPTKAEAIRRNRAGKSVNPTSRTRKRAAPVRDDNDDDDDLDDGDDVPALRGVAPAAALPRPSETRPGARPRRQRGLGAPRGTGAPKRKETANATNDVGGQAPPPASETAATKNHDPAPGPAKRQSKVKVNAETAPAGPARSDSSFSGSSFDISSGEEEMLERLARQAPMSAAGSRWWFREARRRQARKQEEAATRREWNVDEDHQSEEEGQPE